jgi:hypothetical protein
VPLACVIGTVPVHMAADVTADLPSSVTPGQTFDIDNLSVELDVPATVQNDLSGTFSLPRAVEGLMTDLEAGLSGATAAFQNADTSRTGGGVGTWGPDVGGASADPTVGNSTQINLVAATQPPNSFASGTDPIVNGPSPLAAFPFFPEPPLMGAWSFGEAVIDGSGAATTDVNAPVPGTGGGSGLTAGTPDPVSVGPLTATAASGGTITVSLGQPTQTIQFGKSLLEYVTATDQFYLEQDQTLHGGNWSADVGVKCGLDTTTQAVPPPAGSSFVSAATGFQIPVQPPALTPITLSPDSGPLAGGNTVTITGSGFAAGDTVSFGATPAAAVTVVSPTTITATAPAGSEGAVNVSVSDAGGNPVAASAEYGYLAAPTISSIDPTNPVTGEVITINGSDFVTGSTVSFGTAAGPVAATQVTVTAPGVMTAVAPGAAAITSVTVTTPGGTATYTVPPQPTVTSVTPNSGPATGGNTVTINGTNFVPGDTVQFYFDGNATNVTVVSPTQITATAPATPGDAPDTVYVIVSSATGSSNGTSASQYTYLPVCSAPPSVTAPANAAVSVGATAGFSVTTNGTLTCPVAVQWQVSTDGGATFANISGETSLSLSVVTTSVAETGNEYRAVATNADGSTNSGPATLTVSPGAPRGTSAMWVPLACNVGTVPVHLAAEVTEDLPASLTPGQTFKITDGNVQLDFPATAQNSIGSAFGNPSRAEGIVTDLEAALGGASASFQNANTNLTDNNAGTWGPDLGGVSSDPNVGTASQVNLVAASQFPNQASTADSGNITASNLDPLVNGPSPIGGFPDFPETPLMGAWSYGPVNVTPDGVATVDAYAPAPGTGGGAALAAGTPDPVAIGPLTVTASAGGTVTIKLGQASRTIQFGKSMLPFVMSTDQFFFEADNGFTMRAEWSADVGVQCGIDTTAQALPSPDPSFVSAAQGFQIPVVAPLAVSGVSPSSGPTTGGTAITITGTGFASGDTVMVGQAAATNVTVISPTQITATAPAGRAGTVDVTVTGPGGSVSATSPADQYTYIAECTTAPPIATQPASTAVTVGQTATFTVAAGAPANCTTTLQWQVSTDGGTTYSNNGGATGATLTVSATTPAESGNRYRVVATDAAGSTTSTAAILTVKPLPNSPVITTVVPSSGGPFSLVLIMGQHLNGANQVTFGGKPTLFLGIGGQFVIALAPIGPTGTVDIQVRTRIATSSPNTHDQFTYTR